MQLEAYSIRCAFYTYSHTFCVKLIIFILIASRVTINFNGQKLDIFIIITKIYIVIRLYKAFTFI